MATLKLLLHLQEGLPLQVQSELRLMKDWYICTQHFFLQMCIAKAYFFLPHTQMALFFVMT